MNKLSAEFDRAGNSGSKYVLMRPPIRLRASSTMTLSLEKLSSRAAASPAAPAPTIRMSASFVISFLIAAIALSRRDYGLRVFANVLGQRPADVVDLVESALFVTADEALVVAGVDQFTFLFSHFAVLHSLNLLHKKQTEGHWLQLQ